MDKRAKISWLGHLERMEEDMIPKKIFTQELEGTRRRGKHKEGWKEEVERDLHVLGVRRWRELVIDREKWNDIVRQAKAHSVDCSANGRRIIYLACSETSTEMQFDLQYRNISTHFSVTHKHITALQSARFVSSCCADRQTWQISCLPSRSVKTYIYNTQMCPSITQLLKSYTLQ